MIAARDINSSTAEELLGSLHGIIIPGGFGVRSIEGKIEAIRYARTNQVPVLGICLGMQCMVIEFARNVLNWQNASSTEHMPETPYPVITLTGDQAEVVEKGGTNRLGAQPCQLIPGSKAAHIYGTEVISERHRHRYEFNGRYLKDFEQAGMMASGRHPESGLAEVVEVDNHPWFIGAQFHPELKSTPLHPHPLFLGFVSAAKDNKR